MLCCIEAVRTSRHPMLRAVPARLHRPAPAGDRAHAHKQFWKIELSTKIDNQHVKGLAACALLTTRGFITV